MEVEVEPFVVHPQRTREVPRDAEHAPAEARGQMDPIGHHAFDVLVAKR